MKKTMLPTVILVLICSVILYGCSWLRPGSTTNPKTWTPTPPAVRTQSISSVAPDKTASQDTAGAETKLPEAATAQSGTARP